MSYSYMEKCCTNKITFTILVLSLISKLEVETDDGILDFSLHTTQPVQS